jgi:hypothetical protein
LRVLLFLVKSFVYLQVGIAMGDTAGATVVAQEADVATKTRPEFVVTTSGGTTAEGQQSDPDAAEGLEGDDAEV